MRSASLVTNHQEAQELSIIQKQTTEVELEKQRVVSKWSGKKPSHYSTFTIVENVGSFLLLYYCFVILIKYSRAQKGHQNIILLLSVSKVRWLELSQLSLCSEFDKENSMGFLLNSLLLIHFTTVAMRLFSHGPHVTLVMWHIVTVTICHTIVTLWQSHMILSHALSCSYK